MDAAEFDQLLKVARENKVDSFKVTSKNNENLEVVFAPSANYNEIDPKLVPATSKDPDELMLEHIEKLKAQATGGFNQV